MPGGNRRAGPLVPSLDAGSPRAKDHHNRVAHPKNTAREAVGPRASRRLVPKVPRFVDGRLSPAVGESREHESMATDSGPLRDAVRGFNKRVLNPAMMHLAGRKHWYAAVLRHTGRCSGRHYATPVVAVPVPDGFFIVPLPYGTGVDWLRNVQASGKAAITARARTHDVCDPEIIDGATASALLSPLRQRSFRLLGIKDYLKVRTL